MLSSKVINIVFFWNKFKILVGLCRKWSLETEFAPQILWISKATPRGDFAHVEDHWPRWCSVKVKIYCTYFWA